MSNIFNRFIKNESGSIPIEGLMGILLLLGWYAIAFEFYDAFRMRAKASKAAYTVADLLSRQQEEIGPRFVGGMKKVYDYVAEARISERSWMRVSLIECRAENDDWDPCDGVNKKVSLINSYSTDPTVDTHTDTTIKDESFRIPIMSAGETSSIVETSSHYNPVIGIGDKVMIMGGESTRIGLSSSVRFSNFVVTPPRDERHIWNTSK